MEKPDAVTSLKQLILLKEAECEKERKLIADHLQKTFESLKPVNMIKNAFNELVAEPALKTNVINSVIGLAAGFIAKKVFVRKTHNPLMKLAGLILEMTVTNKVANNADQIRSLFDLLLEKIAHRHRDPEKV